MSSILRKLSVSTDCEDWRKDKRLERVARKALNEIRHDQIAFSISVHAVLAGVNSRRPKTFDVAERMVEEVCKTVLSAPINPNLPPEARTELRQHVMMTADELKGADFGMALSDLEK